MRANPSQEVQEVLVASKNNSTRCDVCRKKLGLLGHVCKCGKQCCTSHLQAELHACTYDFRTEGRKQLEKDQMVGPLSDKMTDRI